MQYKNVIEAKFLERPNRFIARVELEGKNNGCKEKTIETVHVKNTGRCRELLIPGVTVWLDEPESTNRKTRYDLIAVKKKNFGIVNIDSQAPNKLVREYLELTAKENSIEDIRSEVSYGESRLDFYFESDGVGTLMEVKGCTLEVDGIGYFPDAPTERGIRHIRELIKAKEEGYRAIIAFVVQMEGVNEVRPNFSTHPEFGEAMEVAKRAGVEVWTMTCKVLPSELSITEVIL